MNKLTVFTITLISFTCIVHLSSGNSIMDTINKGATDVKNKLNDLTKSDSIDLNVCLTNDGCNKSFFKLQNYCCGVQCCDWFTYVFRDK